MKLMKVNVFAVAVFTVLGLASMQTYAGSCGGAAHKHEVKTEEAEGCSVKKGKACGTKKEACETKTSCGEKKTCGEKKACDKAGE